MGKSMARYSLWALVGTWLLAAWGMAAWSAEERVSTAPKGEKLLFAVPAFSVTTVAMAAAHHNGYYRDEQLDVDMLLIKSAMAFRAMLAGSVDYSSNPGSGIDAAVRGIKVKLLFAGDSKANADFMAHPSIKTVQELKGKVVAVSSGGSLEDILTRRILRRLGLDPEKDVIIMAMGTPNLRVAALKAGSVSASLLTAPFNFLAQAEGFHKLLYAGDYEQTVMGGITAPDWKLEKEPQKSQRFVRGSVKGQRFFQKNKGGTVTIMMRYLGLKDRTAAERIYDYHLNAMTEDGILSEAVMKKLIEDSRRANKVTAEFKPQDIFDFRFATRAQEELTASGWRP